MWTAWRTKVMLLCVLAAQAGCGATTADDTGTARFYMDAPLCSGAFPVELSIDHTVAGVDTFRIHLSNPHDTSRPFSVRSGSHVLSARFGAYLFPDKMVSLTPGASVLDSLPFYCS